MLAKLVIFRVAVIIITDLLGLSTVRTIIISVDSALYADLLCDGIRNRGDCRVLDNHNRITSGVFHGFGSCCSICLCTYTPIIPQHLRPVTTKYKRIMLFDKRFQLRVLLLHLQGSFFKRFPVPGSVVHGCFALGIAHLALQPALLLRQLVQPVVCFPVRSRTGKSYIVYAGDEHVYRAMVTVDTINAVRLAVSRFAGSIGMHAAAADFTQKELQKTSPAWATFYSGQPFTISSDKRA